jgi:dipeptidase E
MEMAARQIVAFGGGGFSMESGNPLLDDYVLGLAKAERPRVCFLPSASGDADHYIVRFYRAFSAHRCEASHISLFRREQGPSDLRRHLLSQDLIYVGGGSVVSLLGVWRAHGIDSMLREAWESGVVLCGLSAGSLCWFAEAYHRFLREGMPGGYAAVDGAALHFSGEELSRVVASRPQAWGYRLDVAGSRVVEMRIATTYLGDRDAPPAAPLPEALSTAAAA